MEDHARIEGWLRESFQDEMDRYVWSEPDWHVMIRGHGTLLCHVEIHERIALVGQSPVR